WGEVLGAFTVAALWDGPPAPASALDTGNEDPPPGCPDGGRGRTAFGGGSWPRAYFSLAARRCRALWSRTQRMRPTLPRTPSRFISLMRVETKERLAPTRSARSCWVIPRRSVSPPWGQRSPCCSERVMRVSARRAGTSLKV